MIRLDAQFQTTVQILSGGTVVNSVTTDTLLVSNVQIDFQQGVLHADIQRGSVVGGAFVANYPPVRVKVKDDGSFISDDASWHGTLPGLAQLMNQLKSEFDQFILSSGFVTGTQE